MALRMVVKAVAAKNGLYASFLPKPLEGASGSGLHVNLSLCREGRNLFDRFGVRPEPEALGFTAGILRRAREITAFLNPLANSYRRFGAFEAPGVVSWSGQNRSQLVRVPAAEGESSRIELRSPDPGLQSLPCLHVADGGGARGGAGGSGALPARRLRPLRRERGGARGIRAPAASLGEALALASESGFIRRALPGGSSKTSSPTSGGSLRNGKRPRTNSASSLSGISGAPEGAGRFDGRGCRVWRSGCSWFQGRGAAPRSRDSCANAVFRPCAPPEAAARRAGCSRRAALSWCSSTPRCPTSSGVPWRSKPRARATRASRCS